MTQRHARAIETFARLFGDHDAAVFEISDLARRTHALGQLVRSAYAFIRHENDQVHEGTYSPNTRDHAETARYFLLRIMSVEHAEAQSLLLQATCFFEFEDPY